MTSLWISQFQLPTPTYFYKYANTPLFIQRKLVDHLLRQSQVEEEMKNVLKQYFKSRDITKEEYKNILKKAVPQVTNLNLNRNIPPCKIVRK